MFSLEKGNAEYGLSFSICCKLDVAYFTVCILIFWGQLNLTSNRKESKLQQVLFSEMGSE